MDSSKHEYMTFRKLIEIGFLKMTVQDLNDLSCEYRYEVDGTIGRIKYASDKFNMGYIIRPLINYCGGSNIGAINVPYTTVHRHAGSSLVISEIINHMLVNKGILVYTVPEQQVVMLAFAKSIEKLFEKVPDIEVSYVTVINPNTSNTIRLYTLNFGKLTTALKEKRNNMERNAFINHVIDYMFKYINPPLKNESTPAKPEEGNSAEPKRASALRTP